METFKIILLTVAVCVQVTSQESTGDPPIQIPKPNISQNPTHKVLYSTETVTLHCEVSIRASELQYDWYNDSAILKTEHQSSINVTYGGNYECKAKNGSSESEKSASYPVTLQDRPEAQVQSDWTEAFPGEKVSLQCVIPGSETWIYMWFKDSETIVSSDETSIKDNTLTLSVKSSHGGVYMCQAELKDRTVKTEESKTHSLKVHGSEPTVVLKQDPSYSEIYTGEQVRLTCSIEQKTSNWEYKWQKDSVQVNSHTYTISNATLHQNGEYTCTISRRGITFAKSTKLNITEPPRPKLSIDSQWKTFYPNEKVTLTCSIDGDSNEWGYEWFRNGDRLSGDGDISFSGNTLSIRSAKESHSGQYTCRGKHLKRTPVTTGQTDALKLEIHDNTPKPDISKDQWFEPFYTGEKIQLGCNMPGDGWKYDWYQDSKPLITDPTYIINSTSLSDTGVYNCTAKRGDFSVDSEPLQVRVEDLPKAQVQSDWTEAFPGEKVSLQCVIPGSETWIYMWFNNSERIVSSDETSIKDNTLTLSVKSSHEGSYMCQAELKDRTVETAKSKTHSLTVHGSEPTVVLKQDPSYPEIYTGEQVRLTCSIEQKTSKWEYKWQKDSVQVNNHTYTISNATLHQNGKYTCTISRRGITFAKSTKLNIREPPRPKLSIDSQWKTFYPNEKVTLTCSIDGDSNEWDYEWFRNGTRLSGDGDISFSGNTLSISSAKESHSGQYTCRGKHLKRTPVTTGQTDALKLEIHDNTPKPDIRKDQWFEPFYTGEKIQLGCNMPGDGWKYDWYQDSKHLITDPTYIINSTSLSDTGVYNCTAKRGDFSVDSEPLQVRVEEPPRPELSIESEWKTFYPNEKVILKCSINSNEWDYEWFRNRAKLSGNKEISFSGNRLSIRSAKESHSGQYTCRGKHLKRKPVTTGQTEALKLHIYGDTPKPDIIKYQWFDSFYTEEKIQLGCNMTGDGWKYNWYKDSETLTSHPNHTINSASLSNTGVYHCKAKRGDFPVNSETLQVRVEARPPAVLSLETELSDIMSGNILTLRCNVSDSRQWSYDWFENGQRLNGSADMFKVTATEETIKSEFKCQGRRTERPLSSALSEGFTANNIILKRKILLAISGCLVCCIVILIIGCLVLRITRKPEKNETVQEDLFFSMTDSKNQTASPLEEYMDNSPTEMEECEEKEELLIDRVSDVNVDVVIKDEDSPAAEPNGLTSFKGL